MKQLLILVCSICLLNKADCQGNCQKFKEGTFKLSDPAAGIIDVIVRKGNLQTETVNGDKASEATFIVAWIDDCTYTLKPTKETLAKFADMPPASVLTVKIISTKDNSYTQTSSSNFADMVLTHEVVKIK